MQRMLDCMWKHASNNLDKLLDAMSSTSDEASSRHDLKGTTDNNENSDGKLNDYEFEAKKSDVDSIALTIFTQLLDFQAMQLIILHNWWISMLIQET